MIDLQLGHFSQRPVQTIESRLGLLDQLQREFGRRFFADDVGDTNGPLPFIVRVKDRLAADLAASPFFQFVFAAIAHLAASHDRKQLPEILAILQVRKLIVLDALKKAVHRAQRRVLTVIRST